MCESHSWLLRDRSDRISLCLSGFDGCLLYYFCFNMVVQSPHRWWGNLDKSLHHCEASLSSGCCRSSPGGKQDLYHLKVEQEKEKQEDHVGYLLVIVGIEVLLVEVELPPVCQVEVSPVQSVAQTHVGEDAVTRGEQGVRLQWTLLNDCHVHSFFSYIYERQVCLTSKIGEVPAGKQPMSRQVTSLLTWVGWGIWLGETCKQQIVVFYIIHECPVPSIC